MMGFRLSAVCAGWGCCGGAGAKVTRRVECVWVCCKVAVEARRSPDRSWRWCGGCGAGGRMRGAEE